MFRNVSSLFGFTRALPRGGAYCASRVLFRRCPRHFMPRSLPRGGGTVSPWCIIHHVVSFGVNDHKVVHEYGPGVSSTLPFGAHDHQMEHEYGKTDQMTRGRWPYTWVRVCDAAAAGWGGRGHAGGGHRPRGGGPGAARAGEAQCESSIHHSFH